MSQPVSRREAIRNLTTGAAIIGMTSLANPQTADAAEDAPAKLQGHINHSVCRWCYGGISLDDLCKAAKDMGIVSIDLLSENEWPTIQKYGLVCAMCNGPTTIGDGWNRLENHDKYVAAFEREIPKVAKAGYPNIITFPGNRRGLDDEKGLANCALGLKRIMKVAEENRVTVVMELLNSKVDHKDYQCDHTAWGVELCKRVGSERFKLLYDIYHMQIMDGDIIRTLKHAAPYIAHYHTGGNPGRNEIDETQEIYYPAVMKAIVETGFKGYVAQEFIPKHEPLTSLRKAIQLCDV
jgi:hydroxypyruvate isomerase